MSKRSALDHLPAATGSPCAFGKATLPLPIPVSGDLQPAICDIVEEGSFDSAAACARKFIDDHKGPDTDVDWVIFRDPPCDPDMENVYWAHFPHHPTDTAGLCSEPTRKALYELLRALPPFALGDFTSIEKKDQQEKLARLSAIYLERRCVAPSTKQTTNEANHRIGGRSSGVIKTEADTDGAEVIQLESVGENVGHVTKKKRSTERGEGRAKLIAALTKHHRYADDGCLNLVPIGNNDLARLADVAESTASAFFNKEFNGGESGGLAEYRLICGDAKRLVTALKLLNQEYSPHHLFGAKPRNERDREDKE